MEYRQGEPDRVKQMRTRLDDLMDALSVATEPDRALEIHIEMDELLMNLVVLTGGNKQIQHWIQ